MVTKQNMPQQLSKLLAGVTAINLDSEITINNLSIDSRKTNQGDLFIAYPGTNQDGRNYIVDAIKNGAVAVLCEAQQLDLKQDFGNTPIIAISDLQLKVGHIAANFFDHPSHKMTVIGITGTNGKTSCSHFIANTLQMNGIACGIIGTLGAGLPGNLKPLDNTTPDAVTLQRQLWNFFQQGVKAVAMEVSSHALEQGRVNGIDFNIAVYTNLTRDHIDYHGSMEAYGATKKRLLTWPALQHAVINIDDSFGFSLLHELPAKVPSIIAYGGSGLETGLPTVKASKVELDVNGIRANIDTPWGSGKLDTQLMGIFNVNNLLAVISVLGLMEIPLANVLASVNKLVTIPGRMQTFGGGKQPLVIVDYAHTPDALTAVLIAAQRTCQNGKLWCVFGCGGDRDRGKRGWMGQIAETNSDYVVITDDNPRTEDPQRIVQDILSGMVSKINPNLIVEHDRSKAISYAINSAKVGDTVLIAGKGPEPYQIIGRQKISFSDIDCVQKLLATKK